MSIREYKFRGKNDLNNQFVYGHFVEMYDLIIDRLVLVPCIMGTLPQSFPIPVNKETISQFTGLKDKNGVEIYEGDILKRENEIILVLWDNEYACFTLHCDNWACLGFFYEDLDVDKVEVIGNINDNPELLTKTEKK